MTIGEVARAVGVRTSALRYYEEQGLLPAPERVSGRRVYPPEVLDRLAVIQFAPTCGFSLREVQALFSPRLEGAPISQRWRTLARAKVTELDLLAARVRAMKRGLQQVMGCACVDVAQCGRALRRARAPARGPLRAPR